MLGLAGPGLNDGLGFKKAQQVPKLGELICWLEIRLSLNVS